MNTKQKRVQNSKSVTDCFNLYIIIQSMKKGITLLRKCIYIDNGKG